LSSYFEYFHLVFPLFSASVVICLDMVISSTFNR
jgi:hypothetical protein